MTEYVVGKVDDIPPGTAIAVQAGPRTIAVFRLGEKIADFDVREQTTGTDLVALMTGATSGDLGSTRLLS